MSIDSYASEKDGQPLDLREAKQLYNGKVFVRSNQQKILDKIRRILTNMDLELEEKEPDKYILDQAAKDITDEIREFIL